LRLLKGLCFEIIIENGSIGSLPFVNLLYSKSTLVNKTMVSSLVAFGIHHFSFEWPLRTQTHFCALPLGNNIFLSECILFGDALANCSFVKVACFAAAERQP